MVNNKERQLDLVFAALSDATRRDVLEQLDAGAVTVSELAQSHDMSLPGFMKHLAVLEAACLIARSKEGRVVRCQLEAAPMQGAAMWISRYERFWSGRLDALGRYLNHQEDTEPWTTRTEIQKGRSARALPSPATTRSPPKKSGARGPTRKR